ncbi:MAG: hypothetical protein DRJ03_00105 [Chloroflexi bacterium]|nr:MAG: hypothetical protein DRJ03_00105 [Chloroflexota bacterium]
MKCLVCRQKIKPGQYVLVGAAALCSGPGEDDFDHVEAENDLEGVVHLSCLESPAEAARTPDTAAPGPVEEESAVQRSDALALFNL